MLKCEIKTAEQYYPGAMSSLPNAAVSIENMFKTVRTRKATDWNKELLSKFHFFLMQSTRKKQLTGLQAYCLMVSLASKVISNEFSMLMAELLELLLLEKEERFDLTEFEALGDALFVASETLANGSKPLLSFPLLGEADSAVIVEIEIGSVTVLENLVVFFLTTSKDVQNYQQRLISNANSWLRDTLPFSVMSTPRCLFAALQLIDGSTMLSWSVLNDILAAMCRLPILHFSAQSMNENDFSSLAMVESAFKELERVLMLPTISSQIAIMDFTTQSLLIVIEGLLKQSFDLDRLGIDSMMQYGIEDVLTLSQCKVLELCYLILDVVLEAMIKCSVCAKLTWRQLSVICFDLKSLAMVLAAVRRSRDENGQMLVALPGGLNNRYSGGLMTEDGSSGNGMRVWQDTIMKVCVCLH